MYSMISSDLKKRRFSQSGYTLFEIMLVLGIIAVLVGSAIYMLVGNIDVAKEQRVDSDVEAISMQLRTYEMLNYRMPSTEQGLKALVNQPTTEPRPREYLPREERKRIQQAIKKGRQKLKADIPTQYQSMEFRQPNTPGMQAL